MKRIKKSIEIKALKEKVWKVLLDDSYTREWYNVFSEGSHAQTDWKVGSKAIFSDHSNSGLIAKITANRPNEVIVLEYEGILTNGKEDYDSDFAKMLKGGIETYQLKEAGSAVQLSIESDMNEEYFESMSAAWEKALQKIKEFSESKN